MKQLISEFRLAEPCTHPSTTHATAGMAASTAVLAGVAGLAHALAQGPAAAATATAYGTLHRQTPPGAGVSDSRVDQVCAVAVMWLQSPQHRRPPGRAGPADALHGEALHGEVLHGRGDGRSQVGLRGDPLLLGRVTAPGVAGSSSIHLSPPAGASGHPTSPAVFGRCVGDVRRTSCDVDAVSDGLDSRLSSLDRRRSDQELALIMSAALQAHVV